MKKRENIIEIWQNDIKNRRNTYAQQRFKKKEYYRKTHPVSDKALNYLYLCPECNRVYKRYYHPGKGTKLMYMDSSFPKYQNKKICPECKEN